MQNYLPACKIVSTHGVRGEMKALPLCDGAAFLAKFKRLFARADGETEALPDKGPDAAARSALEFLRRLTESLGLVE